MNNVEDVDNLEIPVRDRFIYSVLTDKYKFEWDRNSHIENKITTLLGFVGIILSLEVAVYLHFLEQIENGVGLNYLSTLFYLLSLIFLFVSTYYLLKAFKVKKWRTVPRVDHFMKEHVEMEKTSTQMIRSLYCIYEDAIADNCKANDKKAENLKYATTCFGAGIFMLFMALGSYVVKNM